MQRTTGHSNGFTLIELLVVVAIIALLLAILAPALDKAIYQAELAVCGANQKGMGGAVVSYAMDFKRTYPYRQAAEAGTAWPASKLDGGNAINDVRRVIRNYIPINKMLIDPLCAKVDLETDQAAGEQVFASYNLWFGWKIKDEKPMKKLGDRFTYNDQSFSILSGDSDTFDFGKSWVQSSHPDPAGQLIPWSIKYKGAEVTGGVTADLPGLAITISIWIRNGQAERGLVDNNFLFDDGSVVRYGQVQSHTDVQPDGRMAAVSWLADRSTATTQLTYLPKH